MRSDGRAFVKVYKAHYIMRNPNGLLESWTVVAHPNILRQTNLPVCDTLDEMQKNIRSNIERYN